MVSSYSPSLSMYMGESMGFCVFNCTRFAMCSMLKNQVTLLILYISLLISVFIFLCSCL